MAEQKTKDLEREYIVPLRKEFLKVPKYRRHGRAMKTIKAFIAKHMKVPARDHSLVKLDASINQEILLKGRKKPPVKIKLRAVKSGDTVKVFLSDMPQQLEFKRNKVEKKHKKPEPKAKPTIAKPEDKVEEKTEEEKKEEKEKAQSAAESDQKDQQEKVKAQKHTSKDKAKPQAQHRKTLSRH